MDGIIFRLVKLLFPHCFPLYSGGQGGGGTESESEKTSVEKSQPWGPVTPYLKGGMSEAQRIYTLGPKKYTPWSQVAGFDPTQLAAMKGTEDYINSDGTQKFIRQGTQTASDLANGGNNTMAGAANRYGGLLSGYLGNKRTSDPSAVINRFMYQDTMDAGLQDMVNKSMTQAHDAYSVPDLGLTNTFGIANNRAAGLNDINFGATANQMMGKAYDTQERQRGSAIDLANGIQKNKANMVADMVNQGNQYDMNARRLGMSYMPQMINAPLGLLNTMNSIGGQKQVLAQAQLDDNTGRFNFDQDAGYNWLTQYRNLINPNPEWGTTTQTATGSGLNINRVPKSNKLAGAAGGALSGATAGAAIGPWGAVVGGLVGAGLGAAGS